VNPHLLDESLAEIDRHVVEGNLVGLGELCQYKLDYQTDDPRMDPLVERAIELDLTMLVHASNASHTSSLGRLAGRFPKARFIMAHLGGVNNWPQGLAVARQHENIWLDASGYVMLAYGAMERALAEVGAGRILFGVDFPAIQAAPLVAALNRLDLRSRDYERIAFRNTAELFKLNSLSKDNNGRPL
jgi:predicted TIM-barrel fold metal-dependent hydrolase